jgi:hypothetical protein
MTRTHQASASAFLRAHYVEPTGKTIIKLDELTITVSERQPDGSYTAWFGDYDLGCMTGWGKTIVAAASDLLDTENDKRITKLAKQMGAV